MKLFKSRLFRLIIGIIILMVSVFIDDKSDSLNFFTLLVAISAIYVILEFIICFIETVRAISSCKNK